MPLRDLIERQSSRHAAGHPGLGGGQVEKPLNKGGLGSGRSGKGRDHQHAKPATKQLARRARGGNKVDHDGIVRPPLRGKRADRSGGGLGNVGDGALQQGVGAGAMAESG